MNKPYFVMLYSQDGNTAMPLVGDDLDWDVKFFETIDEAKEAGHGNMLGTAFGYEVFEMGTGEW